MCINVDVWRVINSQRKMVRAEDRIAAALLNRYRILVFFACRPFGIPLHPVDVSLAAGGGDGDERCALSHALRDEVDSPCVPSRPPFFLGYTSVIFRYGRNFSRPTVYCFFNVGNAPVSSYCHSEPALCRAAFICITAFCQSPSVTIVVPPVLPLPVPCS